MSSFTPGVSQSRADMILFLYVNLCRKPPCTYVRSTWSSAVDFLSSHDVTHTGLRHTFTRQAPGRLSVAGVGQRCSMLVDGFLFVYFEWAQRSHGQVEFPVTRSQENSQPVWKYRNISDVVLLFSENYSGRINIFAVLSACSLYIDIDNCSV